MRRAPQQDNASLGITLVVSAMFIFATQDAITKLLADSFDVPQILLVRFAFYALFAVAILPVKNPSARY